MNDGPNNPPKRLAAVEVPERLAPVEVPERLAPADPPEPPVAPPEPAENGSYVGRAASDDDFDSDETGAEANSKDR